MAPPASTAQDVAGRAVPDGGVAAASGTESAVVGEAAPPQRAGDAVLVERLKRGDEAAFVRLVEDHGRSLRRIAGMYATDAVAEEVVQETWIAVIRGIDGFAGRASIRTWIVRILINIARNRGEREGRQIPFSAFDDPLASPDSTVDPDRFQGPTGRFPGGWISFPQRWDEQPEERYLSTEGVAVAHAAIAELPPAQREVVTLRDVEGWSSDDVSEALGITPGNQRVLLHRGRARVRASLEGAMAKAGIQAGVRS